MPNRARLYHAGLTRVSRLAQVGWYGAPVIRPVAAERMLQASNIAVTAAVSGAVGACGRPMLYVAWVS